MFRKPASQVGALLFPKLVQRRDRLVELLELRQAVAWNDTCSAPVIVGRQHLGQEVETDERVAVVDYE